MPPTQKISSPAVKIGTRFRNPFGIFLLIKSDLTFCLPPLSNRKESPARRLRTKSGGERASRSATAICGSIEISAVSDDEDDGKLSIPICAASVDSTTGERKVRQFVTSAIVLDGGEDVATPDDVSIELRTDQEDDEEPGGDEGKLQFKDFDSDESDSAKGLAERMKVDPKTGEISVNDAGGLMLVARRKLNDGTQKLVYIPLSASGEDPDDEKAEGESDPCEHPGGGGVVVGDKGGAHGGGGIMPPDGGGGVSAEGGAHIGDDGCNCD